MANDDLGMDDCVNSRELSNIEDKLSSVSVQKSGAVRA